MKRDVFKIEQIFNFLSNLTCSNWNVPFLEGRACFLGEEE